MASSLLVRTAAVGGSLALAIGLAACGGGETPAAPETSASQSEATTIQVEDNNGTHTVAIPPQSVVSTDNRTFETLSQFGVELVAAPQGLIPDTIPYSSDSSIIDLGSHNEPNLEGIVAAEPDLVINGQRFTQFQDDFAALVPDATIIVLDPREGEPLDGELIRQTEVLGEIFGKQAEAAQLVADFEASIERVKTAYDPSQTVMAVNTSGGNIGYIAPGVGRTLGPAFELFGLTPALSVDGSDDHQGDDISTETIGESNPDWILVMDRDAAVAAGDPSYVPASELLEASEELAAVTAVQEGNIVFMPADTYVNEGIQTYTEFFNTFADALEAAN